MALNYTGPSRLRRIFEDEYARIARDYDRQGAPRVVINFPYDSACDYAYLFGSSGFSSQEEINAYVNRQIEKLEKISLCENERYAKKKFWEIIDGMKRTRFDTQKIGMIAAYIPYEDAVFFDPYYATIFRFHHGGMKSAPPAYDIPASFGHELVHWNCGETLPCVEIRKSRDEFSRFASYLREYVGALKIGPRAVAIWAKKEGRIEFLKSLDAEDPDLTEGAKRIIERESSRVGSIKSKIEEVNIDIGEEALAYNVGGGKGEFDYWLKKEHVGKAAQGLRMYDALAAKIASNGKLATIREVKQAIDASYSEGRDLFSFFL